MIDYQFGVSLRRIHEDDLSYLFGWRNDPSVFKWCRQYAPLHFYDHLEWFDWQRKDPHTEMFAIISETAIVGVCGLTSIDKVNGRAEFSIYIGPGKGHFGFGESALKTLFAWGFGCLRLNRIWGETYDDNPSARLFEKIGMEHEGTRKEFYYRDGAFINAHLFSISFTMFNSLHPLDGSRVSGDPATAVLTGAKAIPLRRPQNPSDCAASGLQLSR